MIDYMAPLKAFHAEHIHPYCCFNPVGSSPEEVDTVEKMIGFELPLAYRQFLLWMGSDWYGIFQGHSFWTREVKMNTEVLPLFLDEVEEYTGVHIVLPKNYLSFFSSQGCSYAWFELPKRDDNPIVYWFYERLLNQHELVGAPLNAQAKTVTSFTEYIFDWMKYNANFLR